MMTAMVKSSAQTEPSKFQKVTKYALFYSSINVFKISRTFFRAGYIGPGRYVIMIGKTFMHLRVKSVTSQTYHKPTNTY